MTGFKGKMSVVILPIAITALLCGFGLAFADEILFAYQPVFSIERDQYRVNDGDTASFTVTSTESQGVFNLFCDIGYFDYSGFEIPDGWEKFVLTDSGTLTVRTKVTASSFPYSFSIKTKKGSKGSLACFILETADNLNKDHVIRINDIPIPFSPWFDNAAIASVIIDCLECDAFSTYHIGQSHPKILSVQKMLNNTSCPVARVGPGSRGNETETFDVRTYQAIQCYREFYGFEGWSDDTLTQGFIDHLAANQHGFSDVSGESPEIQVVQKYPDSSSVEYGFKVINNGDFIIKDYYLFFSYNPLAFEPPPSSRTGLSGIGFYSDFEHFRVGSSMQYFYYPEPDAPSFTPLGVRIHAPEPDGAFEGVLGVEKLTRKEMRTIDLPLFAKTAIDHLVLNSVLLIDSSGKVVPASIKNIESTLKEDFNEAQLDTSASSEESDMHNNTEENDFIAEKEDDTISISKNWLDKIIDFFFSLF